MYTNIIGKDKLNKTLLGCQTQGDPPTYLGVISPNIDDRRPWVLQNLPRWLI